MSIATPFLHIDYWQRWFAWPSILFTAPVPILVALVALAAARSLRAGSDCSPVPLTQALFALTYAGLGISLYPLIVPPNITIWQAAAPAASQRSCWSAWWC